MSATGNVSTDLDMCREMCAIIREDTGDSTVPDLADFEEIHKLILERAPQWEKAEKRRDQAHLNFRSKLMEYRLEWWERWKVNGKAAAHLEGMALLLHRQLLRRFGGELPEWVAGKLIHASEDDILRWGEGVMSAPGLVELLGYSAA